MVASETTTACEFNDWQHCKFMDEINIKNWSSERFGNKRIGVALLGLGRMGLIHFRNILREPRAHLKYCIDSDHTRLATCQKSMFFRELSIQALHWDQFEVVLADPEVQVVMIATPTNQHEDQTRRALKAGKNVMCEKPLTPQTDSIMPLYELAKANKVFLLTAFNRRYDPDYRQMRERVNMGTLGTVQMIRITSRDCQPPPLSYVQASSGLFHDTCIHDIDMCLWLMRQLPKSIQVVGKTWKEVYLNDSKQYAKLNAHDRALLPEVDDYFMAIITIKFENGSLAVIDNSRQANYGYDQRCEIIGSDAMIKCDGASSSNLVQYDGDAIRHSTLSFGFASRYQAAYVNELQDILTMGELSSGGEEMYENKELIRERLLEPVRPSSVIATHTIADACVEAAKSGNTVELNWPGYFRYQFRTEHEQL